VSNKSKAVLRKSGKASFDPKNFLAKVGGGKTILKCEKDEIATFEFSINLKTAKALGLTGIE
jgi:hypothetical protein